MTASVPDDGSLPPCAVAAPAAEAGRGRFVLAREWAYVINATAYLPLTHAEVEQHMLHLVNRLFDAVRSEPFDPTPAAGVGARLVEMHCVGRDSIRRSAEVLGKALLNQDELHDVERLAERVIAVLGEMMAGYSEALRGGAQHVGTVIEEGNDVALLRRKLTDQALHDSLTGLPNRLSFRAELAKALRRADPTTGITLYQLDLDGFSLITGGHGDELGDRLLEHVARALKNGVAQEKATVARLGADEFGILVENTPATPAVPTMIERLTEALSEPVYLDGEHGLATSASVGVVHQPDPGIRTSELLSAAELTLRRAKSAGRGQWLLADPELDTRDRETAALAASMPGALETGEIRVGYRPVVWLADGRRAAVEALVSWDHARCGRLSHEECLTLAEPTGLILDLGSWLLSSACKRFQGERDELLLSVALTRSQAADPDLVGLVRRVLDSSGLRPNRLVLGFPGRALAEGGETAENLTVLSEIGVRTIVHGFGAVGDVLFLEDLPVHGIRVDRRIAARQAASESATMRVLATTIELAHQAGMRVSVDGVDTEEQAGFWRAAGVDYALGGMFGDTRSRDRARRAPATFGAWPTTTSSPTSTS
ncbi:putative bifunctional diguanylate cyclase/phosphodiesterase [Amycolatopsis taiwanensis]|uniref:Signal transduction protein n=1 Tax=Amycolatopsis taiwanensis TaxID=342230 RepID=A0A9W6VM71_9PSEU|nr:EAL domain-containing protein [Amycolatopsis taiwanensis]GLY71226.1 signal transduction protein [Amycolatopsis taiwanensis]